MSWDEYISSNLMAPVDSNGSTLRSAAILGHDGAVWAQSEDFPEFKGDEFEKLLSSMTEPSITSIAVAGTKYMKISADETVLRCRIGKLGFVARKTTRAVIVGFYEDPPVTGQVCTRIVENLGDYLESLGF